jgi:ferrous iron transport protein B
LQAIDEVASGKTLCKPHRISSGSPRLQKAIASLARQLEDAYPGLPNARWIALRLLDGDERITQALQQGELQELVLGQQQPPRSDEMRMEAAR